MTPEVEEQEEHEPTRRKRGMERNSDVRGEKVSPINEATEKKF